MLGLVVTSSISILDLPMGKKAFAALLLLLVVVGLQLCCCQHAVKIEKIIQERRCHCIVDVAVIH